MAAVSVGTGTVEVEVREVPCGWFRRKRKTVTLRRKDFVGKTVQHVQSALWRKKGWNTLPFPCILNGTRLQGDRVLQAGDKLVLIDP